MNKKRIQIKDVPYVYLDSELFNGTLEEVSSKILNIRNLIKDAYIARELNKQSYRKDLIPTYTSFEEYESIKLDVYNDNGSIEIDYSVDRIETDEEYNIRIQKEEITREKIKISIERSKIARQNTIKEKELKLLQELKKKYE